MIAILQSIGPGWCGEIADLRKKIEVRKTRPRRELQIKVYMYCTIGPHFWRTTKPRDAFYPKGWTCPANGSIFGEYTLRKVDTYAYGPDSDQGADPGAMMYYITTAEGEFTGMEYDKFAEYGGGKTLYGWYIEDLVIYDRPKTIRDMHFTNTTTIPSRSIVFPPQSWCYVEVPDEN